jgi:uncharacterized protein YktA (UPF0223 family)
MHINKEAIIMKVLCLFVLVALVTLASSAPAPKAAHVEYISITDVVDAVNSVKQIFEQIKADIEAGVAKGGIADILKHIKDVVEAKVHEVSPVVADILEEIKAAIQDIIDQAEVGIDTAIDTLLHELFDKIMAKFEELTSKIIGGYNIFDDLLTGVLIPALGKATGIVVSAIDAIRIRLGNLIGKSIPTEYTKIPDIMEIVNRI